MKKLFALFAFLFFMSTAEAAIIYVDGDLSCPGTGATGTPYCSPQGALDHPGLAAGDTIRIRDSATPYDGIFSRSTSPSGTLAAPITIEPDVGHTPTLRSCSADNSNGVITLTDVDHWKIQNLTFNGSGCATTSRYAIQPKTSARSITGIIITGNTFTQWGGTSQGGPSGTGMHLLAASAIRFSGTSGSAFYVSGTISNNTFTAPHKHAIYLNHSQNVTVSGNDISGTRCGIHSTGTDYPESAGIKLGLDGSNFTIINNKVYDSQTGTDCAAAMPNRPDTVSMVLSGIYCDAGPSDGLIEGNQVYNIQRGSFNTTTNNGIWIESRCNRWTIRRNLVRDIGYAGIRIGSAACTNNTGNKIEQNSISNIASLGIWLRNFVANSTIRNNIVTIVSSGSSAAILVDSPAATCGGHVFNGNLYYDNGSNTKIGRWAGGSATNLATWKTNSGQDANALAGDPLFVSSTNLSLQSTSPAIDAGLNIGVSFNGAAPDIGAYEVPTLPAGACTVGLVAANKVVCNFSVNIYPPLAASNFATGWTATKAGSGNTISSATNTGQNQVTYTMASNYVNGDSCTLTYNSATGSLTNTTGFTNHQKYPSVTGFACTNLVQGTPSSAAVIAATNTSVNDPGGTTHTVNLPATIGAGNRLIIIFGSDGNQNPTAPAGFTTIGSSYNSGGDFSCVVYEKVSASGSEGATLTIDTTVSERSAHMSYRITGAHATVASEVTFNAVISGVSGSGVDQTANPPALNPVNFGLEAFRWLAGNCTHGTATYSASPAGYANAVQSTSTGTTSGVMIRALDITTTAESEDPGTFTFQTTGGSAHHTAFTLGIPPAVAGTPTAPGSLQINGFRFEAIDGTEAAPKIKPTQAVAVSTDAQIVIDGAARVRFGVWCKVADCFSDSASTYYTLNGGVATPVPATAGADGIQAFGIADTDPSIPANGTLTTQQITAGTFVPGSMLRTFDVPPALTLTVNSFTELVRFVKLTSSAVADGRFCLFLYNQSGVPLDGAPVPACFTVVGYGASGV